MKMKKFYKLMIFCIACITILQNNAHGEVPMEESLKMDAIKSLEMFHKETGGRLLENSASTKAKALPFVCQSSSPDSCELQELNHRNATAPDTREFVTDGKYRVDIAFINSTDIPRLPWGQGTFSEKTKEESDSIKLAAYAQFFGDGYEELQPEFITSGRESVLIKIYVKDASELEQFTANSQVVGIWHIGNDQVTPEGY